MFQSFYRLLLVFAFVVSSNSTSAQTILQPAGMRSDLLVMKATWENTNAGLYRYNTPSQINQLFDKALARTKEPMLLRQFFILLSQLNAQLHCGHSFVSYYNNKKSIKQELYSGFHLPFLFKVMQGKFIVTHDLSAEKSFAPGTEILALNHVPVKQIIDSLLTVSKADGANGLNKQLDNISIYKRDISLKHYCLFDIYFPLFFKPNVQEENFIVSYKKGKKKLTHSIKGLTKEERWNRYTQYYGKIPVNEETWWVKPLDQKTVLFRLGDFATYNWKFDFKKYLDSVFIAINKEGYIHLILDIRENEGGADEARDAVLSYLIPTQLGCANPVRRLYRYTHIPDSLKKNLDTWDDTFKDNKTGYKKTTEGYYEKDQASLDCDSLKPNPNRFKGKVFLITDATNSSATFIMADFIKSNRLGTLVGEKTGGSQQGINGGELFFFYLPFSQIEMDIPLIWQKPLTDRPDEGIIPDYEVNTTVRDISYQLDPQLTYILKHLLK